MYLFVKKNEFDLTTGCTWNIYTNFEATFWIGDYVNDFHIIRIKDNMQAFHLEDLKRLALDMINSIVKEPEVGQIYLGKVIRIMDFGAFVEFLPGKEGLCHISQISNRRINKVSDVLSEGPSSKVRKIVFSGVICVSGRVQYKLGYNFV